MAGKPDAGMAEQSELHDPSRDHAAIRRLADELLPALMARLEASPLGELQVSQDGWRVRLRKPIEHDPPTDGPVAGSTSPRPRSASGERAPAGRSSSPGSPEQGERARRFITSPAVGTFHPRPGTNLGRAVRAGDVVGHVEVLGVPQEVLAPFDGTLGRVLIEAGHVVEYGEQLMRIDAAGQGLPDRDGAAPTAAGVAADQDR